LGMGDWEWGLGDWEWRPTPNPQSPIPNPQSPIPKILNKIYSKPKIKINYKKYIN